MDNEEFQLEVVQRLTRIETKMDVQNGTVKQNSKDIQILNDKSKVHDAQWSLMKKLSAVGIGIIGIVSTVIPILVTLKVI